jgi:hypothetical protein
VNQAAGFGLASGFAASIGIVGARCSNSGTSFYPELRAGFLDYISQTESSLANV